MEVDEEESIGTVPVDMDETETILNTLRQIPMILETILRLMDVPSLNNLRGVNSRWASIASNFLYKTDLWPAINFEYDHREKKFFHKSSIPSLKKPDSLADFILDCIWSEDPTEEKPSLFPCSKFGFYGGNLNCGPGHAFFHLHGKRIKYLCIKPDAGGDDTDEATLLQILQEKAPNVETLRLGNFYQIHWGEEDFADKFPVKLKFPKITKLVGERGGVGYCTAFDFLSVADLPNLKSVHKFEDYYLDTFVTQNVVFAVKKLCFDIPNEGEDDDIIDRFHRFAHAHPQLDTFLVTSYRDGLDGSTKNKLTNIFNLIFESGKDSLQKLDLCPLGFLPRVNKLPTFKNVTHLSIEQYSGVHDLTNPDVQDFKLFPARTILSQIFPRLEALTFGNCLHFLPDRWDIYFPPGDHVRGPLLTVKTVRVNGAVSLNGLMKLYELVPNVTNLYLAAPPIMTNVEDPIFVGFLQGLRLVFKMYKNLEQLEIYFKWFTPIDLDSLFTGINKDVCKALRVADHAGLLSDDVEPPMREFPALCDLKNLKRLVISIPNKNMEMDHPHKIQLPSSLSSRHAFNLIPGLQVTLNYHQDCGHSSVEIEAAVVNLIRDNVDVNLVNMPTWRFS